MPFAVIEVICDPGLQRLRCGVADAQLLNQDRSVCLELSIGKGALAERFKLLVKYLAGEVELRFPYRATHHEVSGWTALRQEHGDSVCGLPLSKPEPIIQTLPQELLNEGKHDFILPRKAGEPKAAGVRNIRAREPEEPGILAACVCHHCKRRGL